MRFQVLNFQNLDELCEMFFLGGVTCDRNVCLGYVDFLGHLGQFRVHVRSVSKDLFKLFKLFMNNS